MQTSKNRVLYSPQAMGDIKRADDYISNNLCNPLAAKELVKNIFRKINTLKRFPYSGVPLVLSNQTDYRYIVVNNYLIFYRSENSNIYIDRILYSKSNYLKKLISL